MGDSTGANHVRVEVASDGLEAVLHIEPGVEPTMLDPLLICALADERNLLRSPERERAIGEALDAFKANPNAPLRHTILRGTPPVHGENERLQIDPCFTSTDRLPVACENEGDQADPSEGGVDHHAPRIRGAYPSERIGRVVPMKPGIDGTDVRGRALAARVAIRPEWKLDESVVIERDGGIVAQIGGLVDQRDLALAIRPDLLIPGFVDFRTGDIDFPGNLVVQRGVRDRFKVRVRGDLSVEGLVEAGTLACGRDARLLRGMAARGIGSLQVGRDLFAHYLDSVACTVVRDARIEKELTGVTMRVGRDLIAPECAIMRGEVYVARRCDMGTLGSEAGVETSIVLGKLDELERRASELGETLAPLKARLEAARGELSAKPGARASAANAERTTELQFQVNRDQEVLKRLTSVSYKLFGSLLKLTSVDLTVRSCIYRRVTLWMGNMACTFAQDVKGPLRIWLDERGTPMITDLSDQSARPLSAVANVRTDPRFVDVRALAASLKVDMEAVRALAA